MSKSAFHFKVTWQIDFIGSDQKAQPLVSQPNLKVINIVYVCGLFLGELKQQLLKDLNWRRPTEIEGIEIGPLIFKEDNKNKKGDDSKRKQVIFLLDSEVFATFLESIITSQKYWNCQAIPKKITKFECKLNIPDSCKWSSKKRNRKTFEQQQKKSGGGTDDEDDYNTNDSLLSHVDNNKQQEEDVQVVAKVNPHNLNLTQTQEDRNKTTTTIINDYSPKKFKTTILTSATNLSEQQQDNQRIELKSILPVKSKPKITTTPVAAAFSTKSLDLLYTNKLFEIKKRIWSEDLTQDEAEELICDFENFRNANRPEILSKQAKDSLRETEARFAYLIGKWDIDKYSLLAMRTQT